MLTHHTLVTAVASLQGFVDLGNIKMGPNDSFLSFLTLAHIFDRVVEEFMLSVGGHIGYWQVGGILLHIHCCELWVRFGLTAVQSSAVRPLSLTLASTTVLCAWVLLCLPQ